MPPKPIQRDRLRQTIQTLEGLTPEDRSALLGLLAEKKRYGLVWENKPEDAHELLREQIPVFKEDESRRIVARSRSLSDPPQGDCIEGPADDAPHHVLIEGDNLHALAALQYTHAGKVDVIYIDPPYNTGNKDFRYNDNYVDKEDAWRHSKWLSFMEKRLSLGRNLLSESGLIFISIDDNECAQTKVLCDYLFGEGNHIATFIWKSRQIIDSRNQNYSSTDHEYVMTYGKTCKSTLRGKPSSKEKYSNPDNDPRGAWMSNSILGLANAENRPNLHYELVDPVTNRKFPCPPETGWRYSRETISAKIAEKRIVFPKKNDGRPREKKFLSELKSEYTGFSSILAEHAGYTLHGTRELRNVFGEGVFGFPKPVSLVQILIEQIVPSNALILDFFAGSGTTLHATMALNAEDGGKRQCILVTNNENQICEEVTYERNKRVIQGYTTPKGEKVAGLTDNHLHYLKTEFVEREPSLKNRRQLMKLSVDLLRLKENSWERIEALSRKNEVEAFRGNGFTLFVVLDIDAIPTVIERIKDLPGKAKVYVFSPGAYAWDEEFEEVRERIELCAVPEAIYRALEPHLPAVKRIDDEVVA